MNKKSTEKLVREHPTSNGSIKVYQSFDANYKALGESRFAQVEKGNKEEVPMQAKEFELETLKEKQDLWLLNPSSGSQSIILEEYLRRGIPVTEDFTFQPRAWLTPENWKFYVMQMIEHLESWKRANGPLLVESAKTLILLKNETSSRRTNPLHLIIWNVYLRLGNRQPGNPSAEQVWQELLNDHGHYDPESVIEEVTSEHLEWYNTPDHRKYFQRISLDPLLSRMRANPPA